MGWLGVLVSGVVSIGAVGLGVVMWRRVVVPARRAVGDWVRRMAGPDRGLDTCKFGATRRFEGFDVDAWQAGLDRRKASEEASRERDRRAWMF